MAKNSLKTNFNMDIIVTIEKINDVQQFTSKNGTIYKRFSFVGKTSEQFPQTICFTCNNEDAWNKFNLVVGAQVQVYFNLRSKEWNGKWYTDVSCWKVITMGGKQPVTQPTQTAQTPAAPSTATNGNDEIPF